MNQWKHSLFFSLIAATLTVQFFLVGGVHAQTVLGTCGHWSIVKSPSPNLVDDDLYGVAVVSASSVWAVGTTQETRPPYLYQTLIEQWNGSKWSVVASPSIPEANNFLRSVAQVPGTNQLWAVGYTYHDVNRTLIEQWNGTGWQIVLSPDVGSLDNTLNGVVALSATNIWAVGDSYSTQSGHQTLIVHWDGTRWSIVNSPNVPSADNWLRGIAALSADNLWAIGHTYSSGNDQTLIEHWDGTSWHIVTSPSDGLLYGVTAISGTSHLWAVGHTASGESLVERWNGIRWSIIKSPSPSELANELFGVVANSAKDAWVVGTQQTGEATQKVLIEHWNGSKWRVVPSPSPSPVGVLYAIANVANSSQHWAVGGETRTLVEHYC